MGSCSPISAMDSISQATFVWSFARVFASGRRMDATGSSMMRDCARQEGRTHTWVSSWALVGGARARATHRATDVLRRHIVLGARAGSARGGE